MSFCETTTAGQALFENRGEATETTWP